MQLLLKNIEDIEIENGIWTISRVNIVNISSIIERLKSLHYTGADRIKDSEIENTRFPPFAQVFYYLVYQFRKIPTEDLFFEEYIKWIELTMVDGEYFIYEKKKLLIQGLKGRILRTYPSLIRDLHFYYLLLSSNKFEDVSYSLSKDFYDGIDITIKYRQKVFGVSIHIDTQRGANYKKLKEKRHNYIAFNEIILSVKFLDLDKIGHFYVLGSKQIDMLLLSCENLTNNLV